MIDLDRVEREIINYGVSVHADTAIKLITRLRQAEKDAARYRWLRDSASDSDVCEALFNAGYDEFDNFIDEAMNGSNN